MIRKNLPLNDLCEGVLEVMHHFSFLILFSDHVKQDLPALLKEGEQGRFSS
jgi:hypothetical protein